MKERIFVCIASYRDKQLERTVCSVIENAEHPELIDIWILNQLNFKEDKNCVISEVEKYPQISQSLIDYRESKWCCWARNYVYENFFKNQKFILQLDSHCRVSKNWDTELKNMWKWLNDKKAVISHYAMPFWDDEIFRNDYFSKFKVLKFFDNSPIPFLEGFTSWEFPERPVKVAFMAWWFVFWPWKMIREVPYDPYLYFYWEESVYAARLWTSWYNIYAPNKTLVWHYFEKSDNRPRHWNDNEGWSDLESLSVARCKSILWVEDIFDFEVLWALDKYWLWKERTLEEYERFSWIFFKEQIIKDYAKNGEVNENYKDYEK